MDLGLKINKIPVELGQHLASETLDAASFRRAGLLRRLLSQDPAKQSVYGLNDCELQGLNDELHIYPCNHSYLNDVPPTEFEDTYHAQQRATQLIGNQ